MTLSLSFFLTIRRGESTAALAPPALDTSSHSPSISSPPGGLGAYGLAWQQMRETCQSVVLNKPIFHPPPSLIASRGFLSFAFTSLFICPPLPSFLWSSTTPTRVSFPGFFPSHFIFCALSTLFLHSSFFYLLISSSFLLPFLLSPSLFFYPPLSFCFLPSPLLLLLYGWLQLEAHTSFSASRWDRAVLLAGDGEGEGRPGMDFICSRGVRTSQRRRDRSAPAPSPSPSPSSGRATSETCAAFCFMKGKSGFPLNSCFHLSPAYSAHSEYVLHALTFVLHMHARARTRASHRASVWMRL